jgi:hypothetical protein
MDEEIGRNGKRESERSCSTSWQWPTVKMDVVYMNEM